MRRVRVRGASAWTDGRVFCRVRIREGDEPAAKALFSALRGTGPVSPTPCAFGEGVLTEGFQLQKEGILLPQNSQWLAQQFAKVATPVTKWVGLDADVQTVLSRVGKAAPWAQARFGITCRLSRIDRDCAQKMAHVLGAENEALFAALTRVPRSARVLLAEKNGEAVGFLLLLFRHRRARVATAWIKESHRRAGVLSVMVYHACLELQRRHIPHCDISMIEETNTASLLTAQHLGAVIDRRFAMYNM